MPAFKWHLNGVFRIPRSACEIKKKRLKKKKKQVRWRWVFMMNLNYFQKSFLGFGTGGLYRA